MFPFSEYKQMYKLVFLLKSSMISIKISIAILCLLVEISYSNWMRHLQQHRFVSNLFDELMHSELNPYTYRNARSQIKSWIEAMHRYVIQHTLNKFQFIIDFQAQARRCDALPCKIKCILNVVANVQCALYKMQYMWIFFSSSSCIDRQIKF